MKSISTLWIISKLLLCTVFFFFNFFFHLLCSWRTWVVIALHNILSFLFLNSIYPYKSSSSPWSVIHLHKLMLINFLNPLTLCDTEISIIIIFSRPFHFFHRSKPERFELVMLIYCKPILIYLHEHSNFCLSSVKNPFVTSLNRTNVYFFYVSLNRTSFSVFFFFHTFHFFSSV